MTIEKHPKAPHNRVADWQKNLKPGDKCLLEKDSGEIVPVTVRAEPFQTQGVGGRRTGALWVCWFNEIRGYYALSRTQKLKEPT